MYTFFFKKKELVLTITEVWKESKINLQGKLGGWRPREETSSSPKAICCQNSLLFRGSQSLFHSGLQMIG